MKDSKVVIILEVLRLPDSTINKELKEKAKEVMLKFLEEKES